MDLGEIILSSLLGSFFQVLWDRLVSLGHNFGQREGIDARTEDWKKMLQDIYWHLDDAEERQLFNDQAVKSWLEDARNLAYDMEDLLDDFAIEAAKQEQGAESSVSGSLRKRKWSSFSSLVSDRNMTPRVRDIGSRLQDILTQKDRLRLKESIESRSTSIQGGKRLPSTSLKEACFLGREEEENEIIQLLTMDDNRTIPTIIPFVGMGGIGKTALAQKVYNDPKVTKHFKVKAWTCVSDDFDVSSITRAILQSITSKNCEGKDINWLQVNLKKALSGKKFLIVLDDIWNEKYEEWTILLKPLESGAKGSKVIITTRNLKVASIAKTPAYLLKELQHDDCIALFAYHALGVNNFNDYPHLEVIGKKIVDKCGGIPLAIKSLGGLLCTTVEVSEWEAISNSKLWNLPKERNEILPALKLSYVHLPSNLKRCFAYCAIFPKDYEIERDKLIHWWMGEGLLGDNNKTNRWDIGLNYFGELVSRSFFQQGKGSRYLMHDLIHDLAMSISGVTCFSEQELKLEAYESNAFFARARHASFLQTYCVTSEKLRRYHRMEKLRSFVALTSRFPITCYISREALSDLVSKLKHLRVFSMSHYQITEVPDLICKLKHLRHLDFSYTDIQTLPKSIGLIYNLEALLLRGCKKLSKLPEEIEQLYNLQYIDIRDTPNLTAMPSNLANLKMLSRYIVGTQKGSRLEELKNVMHPEGELVISELHQVKQVEDVRNVNLCEKQGISKLVLEWAHDFNDSRNEEHKNAILKFLQPHINLRSLRISHYDGTRFPTWLGSALYVSIVHVDVSGCHNVTSLPAFGQLPSLKELRVHGLKLLRKVGNEFYGSEKPFPSLKTLEFSEMLAWDEWSHCDGIHEVETSFGCLQHLIIRHCPRLVGRMPGRLDSLTNLQISSCPCLKESSHVISLPALHRLDLKECNVGVLNSLVDLTSLTTLRIDNISELTHFESGFINSLAKLEMVQIENCEKLNYLWQDSTEVQNLASLKSLAIKNCPHLASLMTMPPHIQGFTIIKCDSLPALMFKRYKFPISLKSLYIKKCEGVQRTSQIFGTEHQWIEKINIEACINLRSLKFDGLSHLKELCIQNCEALEVKHFPLLPITVSRFQLEGCPSIKWLPNNLHQLTSLETLHIYECENIRCFPKRGLPPNLKDLQVIYCGALKMDCFAPLPIALSNFYLKGCPNIKCLPNNLHQLTSLETLRIWNCTNIRCLPEGGFPHNLQQLDISRCKNMTTPMREWGLHQLSSLDDLYIDGSIRGVGEKPCFVAPTDDNNGEENAWGFLPSSLTSLHICNMREGERLSSGLCHHLPSLRFMSISKCPKLKYLPKDGLPLSLEHLWISDCGRLEERFSKPSGDYCYLFYELPHVMINSKDMN